MAVVELSGGLIGEPADEMPGRAAILAWGQYNVGKTTFAATAPGKKLWLSFGDNEHVSVAHRKDVTVVKLYDMSTDDLFKHGQGDNPFGLDEALAKHTDIATVVTDSVTALTFRALQKAVRDGTGAGKAFKPTMQAPGKSAYGGRNGLVLEVLTGLLKVTAKHNVHLVMTAHEADPTTTTDGTGKEIIDYIGVMLGGQLVSNVTWRLSEIWYMSMDRHGTRRLAVRPTRLRRPMKTRMFTGKGEPEFVLDYDPDKPDKGQMTIASWYDKWEKGGFAKLAIPGKSK